MTLFFVETKKKPKQAYDVLQIDRQHSLGIMMANVRTGDIVYISMEQLANEFKRVTQRIIQ